MKQAFRTIARVVTGAMLITSSVAVIAATTPDWVQQPAKKQLNQLTIGMSMCGLSLSPYMAAYEKAFEAYAKELGVKTVLLDAQGDPARQTNQIQDLIAQRPDALVVWPVNGKAVVPAVRQASTAGVPVVVTNSPIDQAGVKYIKSFTGPDDYSEGLTAGKLLAKGLNGKGNVVLINGLPGYITATLREKGYRDALAQYPDIKIIDSQPADWKREKAQSVMEAYISRFGDKIDGVGAADDETGSGALNAVNAAVKDGKLKPGKPIITGATNFAVGYDAIKAGGSYYASVVQSPAEDARLALRTAVETALGQPVKPQLHFDTPAITRENLDKFPRPVF
jgi:ribose transport system substrate-binding protein